MTRSVNEEKANPQQFQWTSTPPLMMAMVSVVHRIRSQGIAARLMMVMVMIVMVMVVMVVMVVVVVVVVVMVLVLVVVVVVVVFVSQVYIAT
jgi:20S proteasome subunit beta 7